MNVDEEKKRSQVFLFKKAVPIVEKHCYLWNGQSLISHSTPTPTPNTKELRLVRVLIQPEWLSNNQWIKHTKHIGFLKKSTSWMLFSFSLAFDNWKYSEILVSQMASLRERNGFHYWRAQVHMRGAVSMDHVKKPTFPRNSWHWDSRWGKNNSFELCELSIKPVSLHSSWRDTLLLKGLGGRLEWKLCLTNEQQTFGEPREMECGKERN